MKKFTLSEKILLALYQGIDQRALTYRPFSYLLKLFPNNNSASLRVLTDKLVEKGCLEKIEKEGKILLAITDFGRKEIVREPQSVEPWDNKMHLVILSVPEKERPIRQKIRTALEKHNYRLLHMGIWFSPVKTEGLISLLKQEKLLEYVMFLEALPDEAIKQLIISLWQLEFLQMSYEKYLREASQMQNLKQFDTSRYINLLKLQEFLLVTLRSDPLFPDNLFKLSPLRKKAWSIFQNLCQRRML